MTKSSPSVIQKRGNPFKIILICKVIDRSEWFIVSNPKEDYAYKAAKIVLANSFNDYMAYMNTGVEYRFIRHQDLNKYGIAP
jgi:hypothetical protein